MSVCDTCRMETKKVCPLRAMIAECDFDVGRHCKMHDAIEDAIDEEVASLRKRVQRLQGITNPIPTELLRKPATGQETQQGLF